MPWAEARGRLEEGGTYWLATARPDGRPHVMPVLGVWVDGALCFSAGETSRKGKNLARDPRCDFTAGSRRALDLVVEGEAAKVSDMVTLHRVAEAYASKYGWSVTVRDGAFYADGAPTAGPPPTRFTKQRPRRSSVLARTGRSARHAGASGES
jgi:nitroimidazol reductase NimA-like FMN-containing flavoprotein (pyridoxamine 5'-phosphate oxidase superfamily)